MADRPVEAVRLVAGHAPAAFFESRDGKRVGEGEGRPGWRLEEELVGNAAVFVFVTTALANILHQAH